MPTRLRLNVGTDDERPGLWFLQLTGLLLPQSCSAGQLHAAMLATRKDSAWGACQRTREREKSTENGGETILRALAERRLS
ncbi:uncharacterized protein SPSK_10544 [Sporothrix schenckii 1099-18]|uniref:Uncharacterized protein n=1 Tax=Sporothrix schenckii 1099-18 TaxID=1397361 RepID=A0A0F2LZI3_SPOSC|nr:uncharacterized protein SPSK_10544 [Sporothrix schenckii 1099-18]KJR82239.1 hypothetical protein SPSK_10544 [Sporothrix schenckii 1099-18]